MGNREVMQEWRARLDVIECSAMFENVRRDLRSCIDMYQTHVYHILQFVTTERRYISAIYGTSNDFRQTFLLIL